MKIIIGSESFAPNISGVAVHAELLASNLCKAGHTVYVFAPSRKYASGYDPGTEKYKIFRLKSVVNPFREGFRVAFLPSRDVEREVRRIKPDLIHLQDPTSICSALLKIGRKMNIPVVATNHFSLKYVTSYLKFLKPLHPQIHYILGKYLSGFYNKTSPVFCPTETVKKELQEWGVKTKIEAISNGVDLGRFFSYSAPSTIREKYHLPINKTVLYVGRIDKDKSIEVLVNAIPMIAKKSNAHFIFAGLGDEIPKMQTLAKKLGVSNLVSFLGRIDHESEDLPLIYQTADVFCIPSTIETQSIVTLEAMASGLPVVAANSGALPELVRDGQNGYLFKPGDSEGLAKKVISILNSPTAAKKMSAVSLQIVSGHAILQSLAKIIANYEEILASHK